MGDGCARDRSWWIFILTIVGTFVGGLLLILGARVFRYCSTVLFPRSSREVNTVFAAHEEQLVVIRGPEGFVVRDDAKGWAINFKQVVGGFLSLERKTGKYMAVLTFIFSMLSIITYFVDSYKNIERCISLGSASFIVDLVANGFFTIHFIMRFIAADKKLSMWLELASFVDFFTIPPVVVTIVTEHTWLGFRFMRILRLVQFTEIIQITGIIKSGSRLQLVIAGINFFSFWLAASGFIHMIENYGDPWKAYSETNSQSLTYPTCVYFTMVTMSTVGYGDEGAQTATGRAFMVFFIVGGLTLFATYSPLIVDYIQSLSPYEGSYHKDKRPHIVVCGHVTEDSIGNFLADFLHKDRAFDNTVVVFLHTEKPSSAVASLLKKLFTRVAYIRGSALNPRDLVRVKLQQAEACIILTDKYTSDPDGEDSANVMRVIAAKNCCSTVRVVVQLIQVESKVYLQNISGFSEARDVVCITELKLGMIAQSCLCPGFSTFLANLTCMRSESQVVGGPHQLLAADSWEKIYRCGAAFELYSAQLSNKFIGKTFDKAVRICYEELDVVLFAVAVSNPDSHESQRILLNPAGKWLVLTEGCVGFFIAEDSKQLEKVEHYGLYDKDVKGSPSSSIEMTSRNDSPLNARKTASMAHEWKNVMSTRNSRSIHSMSPVYSRMTLESDLATNKGHHSGLTRNYEHAILKREECLQLCGHIVILMFGRKDSPLLGLHCLLKPLRSLNFEKEALKQVVFVGNGAYLQREGSPLDGNVLQKAALNYCDICIILSPRPDEKQTAAMEELALMDKESILTTLNIKGMKFSELENNPLVLHAGGPAVVGHEARKQRAGQHPVRHGADIHTLTDLLIDTNVQLLDFDDDDDITAEFELYRTTPFADGKVVATSVLDSLMSAIYFNPNIVTVIKLLICGQIGLQCHEELSDDHERGDNNDLKSRSISCHVQQYDLFSSPYAHYGEMSAENMLRYGDLFLTLLEKERMLCLGLYRCRNSLDQNGPRYVITAPASNFQLLKFDSLFVLCCGNQSCSEESIVLTQSDDEVQFGSIRTVNVKEKNHPLFGSNDDVTAV